MFTPPSNWMLALSAASPDDPLAASPLPPPPGPLETSLPPDASVSPLVPPLPALPLEPEPDCPPPEPVVEPAPTLVAEDPPAPVFEAPVLAPFAPPAPVPLEAGSMFRILKSDPSLHPDANAALKRKGNASRYLEIIVPCFFEAASAERGVDQRVRGLAVLHVAGVPPRYPVAAIPCFFVTATTTHRPVRYPCSNVL